MNLELLTIGTELLLGYTVDTNGAELARELGAVGVQVVRKTSVPDREEAIRDAVTEALHRTGAVITTGGLGPTRDDITKRIVAEIFQAPLEFDEAVWQGIVERFKRLGRTPADSNRGQAEVPRGAVVLNNRWGTAPGLWLEGRTGLAILLPGVPREMRRLLEHEVLPRLRPRSGSRVVRSRTVRTTGIPESRLAEVLGEVESRLAPLTLAYLPGVFGVDLRVTAWDLPPEEAAGPLAAAVTLLSELAGKYAYGEEETDLAEVVLREARERSWQLAVAESCTGGLVGARLTAIPGSSEVFVGGVIAYDNRVKIRQLGVSDDLLARHGAVSELVVRAMAEGAARKFEVEAGLAVTGIAGPGGGSEEKPVGTIWLGLYLDGRTEAVRQTIPGDRDEVRARAAQAGLYL
ncbi:MAG: competence/damage-inducible protein A, partial [Gemmatimonadales bacterium]